MEMSNMSDCNHDLQAAGKAYPRTCALCRLGPCHKHLQGRGTEGVASPMGWFYRVEARADANPNVYRCKLGQAWERMEVYDIGEVTPEELRFIADVIDASKAAA